MLGLYGVASSSCTYLQESMSLPCATCRTSTSMASTGGGVCSPRMCAGTREAVGDLTGIGSIFFGLEGACAQPQDFGRSDAKEDAALEASTSLSCSFRTCAPSMPFRDGGKPSSTTQHQIHRTRFQMCFLGSAAEAALKYTDTEQESPTTTDRPDSPCHRCTSSPPATPSFSSRRCSRTSSALPSHRH